jgi:predicted secreted hydrolase
MRSALLPLALALLALPGCERASRSTAPSGGTALAAPSRLDALLADPGAGFARADSVRTFSFPTDHGPHPDFRHEWWYVTGNLDSSAGERFGFELTFFRFALAPADPPAREDASAWRTRQVYMAHFAITDVSRERFAFDERLARGALELASARAEPFAVWLEDWSLEAQSGPASCWRLRAAGGNYALDLELDAAGPLVRNGEQGLSRKSSSGDAASYYYSLPRMPARGTLAREGEPLAVSGLAWLDREWGSGALDPGQEGWDWFALQLDDGSALMLYALRLRAGGSDPASGGTWLAPDGAVRTLDSSAYRIEVRDHWTSPRGGRYPSRWRVEVPSLGLELDVEPVLADQELDTQPRYWEGAVDVRGTRAGTAASGRGYVELVGYARESGGAAGSESSSSARKRSDRSAMAERSLASLRSPSNAVAMRGLRPSSRWLRSAKFQYR